MTSKKDDQQARIAEKKATRELQAKALSKVDRLQEPGVGKTSKAKGRLSAKPTTRASPAALDANGIPQVTAAPLPVG
jgi:hypothetical protein